MTTNSAERSDAIRRIANVLEEMGTIGANDMDCLTYNEAKAYHAITERMSRFVDKLVCTLPLEEFPFL